MGSKPTLGWPISSTLVIGKFGHLSRDVAKLMAHRNSFWRCLTCDIAEADDLTDGIMALVA